MSEYVTKGAMMKCTCGSAPSQMEVTSNTFYSIQGNMAATTNDKAPMVNIKPFGTCTMKPSVSGFLPCVPSPTVWTGFLNSVSIGNGKALVDSSTIQCTMGGCISFQNSGQMKPNKVVTIPNSPQIDVLKRAAIEAIPFCEECEKKTPKVNPKILRIYCMDEQREFIKLSDLEEKRKVTLCVEVEDGGAGEKIDAEITAPEGRLFKDGKTSIKFTDLVIEDDNTAYVDNFSYEFNKD